jgi:hypothetical protein
MGIVMMMLYAPLYPVIAVNAFVLFMRLCRYAIRAVTNRWASRPTWTERHEDERRNLMRSPDGV